MMIDNQFTQDFPGQLLPAALQNSNPLNIPRLVNGNWTAAKIKD
jgi:hypothetical protein